MVEESKYKGLPEAALIATLEDFENEKSKAAAEIEQMKKEKQQLLKEKGDLEKKVEQSLEVGGTLLSKVKDINEILDTCGYSPDEIPEYSQFYQGEIEKGKPHIFLNAVNGRLSSLAARNLKDIEDSQVDENGEVLIKTVKDMKEFINGYDSDSKIDINFPKRYNEFVSKFQSHEKMIEKWQNYVVRKNNLTEAGHHAFLITQKAIGKATNIVIEASEQKENKELADLKEKYGKLEQVVSKLQDQLGKQESEKAKAQADEAKNELLQSVASAKSSVEAEGIQPDLVATPELPNLSEDEDSKKTGRRGGRR